MRPSRGFDAKSESESGDAEAEAGAEWPLRMQRQAFMRTLEAKAARLVLLDSRQSSTSVDSVRYAGI